MPRNFGLNGDRTYLNVRPKGCECQTWRQAEACYEYCYQDIARPTAPRDLGPAGLACVVLLIIFAAVIVLWPRPSHGSAFYCKPLARFERSCTGVKAAASVLGKSNARALAVRCGATPEELQEAEACFVQKQCPPVWQCNGSKETNHPDCYARECRR